MFAHEYFLRKQRGPQKLKSGPGLQMLQQTNGYRSVLVLYFWMSCCPFKETFSYSNLYKMLPSFWNLFLCPLFCCPGNCIYSVSVEQIEEEEVDKYLFSKLSHTRLYHGIQNLLTDLCLWVWERARGSGSGSGVLAE